MSQATILVVEDNPMNAKLFRDLLEFNDFRVLQTVTAEHGIELARSEAPRVILMDVQLPGMDGMEALRILKGDPMTASIPIIAVTASVMPDERSQVMAAGFDGFQSKPISIKDLLAEIHRVIGDA